jgi:hypothetical protein
MNLLLNLLHHLLLNLLLHLLMHHLLNLLPHNLLLHHLLLHNLLNLLLHNLLLHNLLLHHLLLHNLHNLLLHNLLLHNLLLHHLLNLLSCNPDLIHVFSASVVRKPVSIPLFLFAAGKGCVVVHLQLMLQLSPVQRIALSPLLSNSECNFLINLIRVSAGGVRCSQFRLNV